MAADPLLRRAQEGDPAALEELCRREWRSVYALVYRTVGQAAEAQDLTQEVFLRALRTLDRYEDTGAPFRSYLAQVARNLIRDRWRKRQPALVELEQAGQFPARGIGPEEEAVAAAERAEIMRLLATLPDDQQTVLRLRLIEHRPAAEVAELMRRSPGAVRQLQRRALLALRAALREESRP